MENKKIIIITIVLFLLAGTGTFVFASNQGSFNEEDIDYSIDKGPTYEKVDSDDKSGQKVPVIDNSNTEKNNPDNNNSSSSINDNTLNNPATKPNQTQSNLGNRPKPTVKPDNTKPENGSESTGSQTNTENNKENNVQDNTKPALTAFEAKLTYDKSLTNQNVVLTITTNKTISIISDKGWVKTSDTTAEKIIEENDKSEQSVTITANSGQTQVIKYQITNIDKEIPITEVTYSETEKTFRPIIVTIRSNKNIAEVSEAGWTYLNSKIITKTFKENIENKIVIRDEAGNETEVGYNINNYEDKPIINTSEENGITSITLTYKEPTKISDNWEKLENGDYKTTIEIKNNDNNNVSLPDGNMIKVLISNEDEDGSQKKTNKPVVVTILSNKELENLEGWILSTNKKSLTKFVTESMAEDVKIKYTDGTSDIIKYEVSNIDMIAPYILNIVASELDADGYSTLTIKTSERTSLPDKNWSGKRVAGYAIQYTKKVHINDIKTETGYIEYITFEDRFWNKTTETIKVVYNAEDGKIIPSIVKN